MSAFEIRRPGLAAIVTLLDLAGTFFFGLEGAMAAASAGLDWFGLFVLAFVVALGGGMIRDVLIGAVPPGALSNWHLPLAAVLGGAVCLLLRAAVFSVPDGARMAVDAAGLSLFAISGAAKALEYGVPAYAAVLMGGITGVGGGTVRDLLLNRVPAVLRSDVYATAALAGALVFILLLRIRIPMRVAAILSAAFCFALRMVALWRHWNLPRLTSRG